MNASDPGSIPGSATFLYNNMIMVNILQLNVFMSSFKYINCLTFFFYIK